MIADLRSLAVALGGEVQGRQVVCPGPGHSRRDRSLSVRLSPQSPTGFIVFSHAGDDFREARDYVTAKLGMDLDVWRTHGRGEDRPAPDYRVPEPGPEPDRERRIARARAIWDAGSDPRATVVERYLAGRGLELPPGADALRFNPRTPWRDDATGEVIRIPAMVALLRNVEGDAVTGVHKTRLSDDGRKVGRKMQGIAAGAAIKLDGDDAVTTGLAIAEGCETALQGQQLGFRPAWALGSAGGIAAFPVLPGVECLTIHAERDDTNARAVETCARRWHAAGREVVVVEPRSGSDLNDATRGWGC